MYKLLFITICVIAVTGCLENTRFNDLSDTIRPIVIPAPIGDYDDVAWISDHTFAFLYFPENPGHNDSNIQPQLRDYIPIIYDAETNSSRQFPITTTQDCQQIWVLTLQRETSDSLLTLHQCLITPSKQQQSLVRSYLSRREAQLIQVFPPQFRVRSFTEDVYLRNLVIGEERGGIHDQVYRTNPKNELELLLPSLQRSASPTLSEVSSSLAFIGNETLPKTQDNLFTALLGIGDLLFYPWNLYIAGADGSQSHIVLTEIKLADTVKWSPVDVRLAFRGEYTGAKGIWILNTTTLTLTRVWNNLDYYDWSPDGTRLVVLQQRNVNGKTQGTPVIIDVSAVK